MFSLEWIRGPSFNFAGFLSCQAMGKPFVFLTLCSIYHLFFAPEREKLLHCFRVFFFSSPLWHIFLFVYRIHEVSEAGRKVFKKNLNTSRRFWIYFFNSKWRVESGKHYLFDIVWNKHITHTLQVLFADILFYQGHSGYFISN